jgi:hypothetical protein
MKKFLSLMALCFSFVGSTFNAQANNDLDEVCRYIQRSSLTPLTYKELLLEAQKYSTQQNNDDWDVVCKAMPIFSKPVSSDVILPFTNDGWHKLKEARGNILDNLDLFKKGIPSLTTTQAVAEFIDAKTGQPTSNLTPLQFSINYALTAIYANAYDYKNRNPEGFWHHSQPLNPNIRIGKPSAD